MRKGRPKPRITLPDHKYNDVLVHKFVCNLMKHGKKTVAFKIFYKALDLIAKKAESVGLTPLEYWKKALENVTPQVEVRSQRIGGATYQIPVEIRPERKISLSIKNMIKAARARSGKTMAEKLAAEIIAAYNNEGGAYKRKEEIHRMAEANKAFAHFRF